MKRRERGCLEEHRGVARALRPLTAECREQPAAEEQLLEDGRQHRDQQPTPTSQGWDRTGP